MKFNSGQVVGISRIRQALNLALPTQRCECDRVMIQRRTATEHKVPCIWVGMGASSGPDWRKGARCAYLPATSMAGCCAPTGRDQRA
jgi:hypothetical protein